MEINGNGTGEFEAPPEITPPPAPKPDPPTPTAKAAPIDSKVIRPSKGAKSQKRKKEKKSTPPPRKGKAMAKEKKGSDVVKIAMNVDEDVAKNVRRLQAQLMMDSGEKVSYSDAIRVAVEAALK
jgi:hypothetical protein